MSVATKVQEPFKTCNCCRINWESRSHFIDDPNILLLGYQANFDDLELGLLLFNHSKCGTTLALEVQDFRDLYDGPVYQERATLGPECPGYCVEKRNLSSCKAKCECAFVREIMCIVKDKRSS